MGELLLMRNPVFFLIPAMCFAASAAALPIPGPSEQAVFVRILDVGPGLCCVIQLPGGKFVLYDAGHYAGGGSRAFRGISEIIPAGADIELMILSHSDADHLGAADEVCEAYNVKRVLRTGMKRSTATWRKANRAINKEETEGCIDMNLSEIEILPGATFRFGEVFVTIVYGLGEPLEQWDAEGLNDAELRNSVSIVIRIQYDNKSILFCGDTIGRLIEDADNEPSTAAEKEMLLNAPAVTIDSDVIIAPHHGGNNGSSAAFIDAVSPDFVIFSAGSQYDHPHAGTVGRYLASGVALSDIFRTDTGDNEGGSEWDDGLTQGDRAGDDDIDLLIRKGVPTITVEYRNTQ